VNGFVFNFETPGQIVSRNMFYRAQDLPTDWLQRYLSGVQAVRPQDIQNVFAQHLRPDQMTILIVGDPDRIGRAELEALGPVTILVIH
jgi:zinc protease